MMKLLIQGTHRQPGFLFEFLHDKRHGGNVVFYDGSCTLGLDVLSELHATSRCEDREAVA